MLYSYLGLWENCIKNALTYNQMSSFSFYPDSPLYPFKGLSSYRQILSSVFAAFDVFLRSWPVDLKMKEAFFTKITLHNSITKYIRKSESCLKKGKLCAWMLFWRETMQGIVCTKTLCHPFVLFLNPKRVIKRFCLFK